MAVNLIPQTERFDNAQWTKFDGLSVTEDVGVVAIPGIGPRQWTRLSDTGAAQDSIYSEYQTIPNDSADYLHSLYIKKDSNQSRFPEILCQFAGGTGIGAGVSVNTATGAIANAPGETTTPTASGVDDLGSAWRVWFKCPNNNTGNTLLRMGIFPARSDSLGGGAQASATGSIDVIGANQTQDSTLQFYDPTPDVQHARPNADVSDGSWTPSAGTDLFDTVEEFPPDNADYMLSSSSPASDRAIVGLSSLTTPNSGPAVLRIRARLN